ncbi:CDP-alcohol phosphatidyltransferase family protein [Prevotella nigrescens]
MNIENKTFGELLKASMKSDDTEEWIDVYFTRPVGLAFALLWHRLGVTPNTITLLSIALGVAAGAMFYFQNLCYNIIGVVLLVLANLCDSTDGQLARLTNQRSMKGRCLDGFAGDTWFFAIYLAISLRLWHQTMPGTTEVWGPFGLALAAIAGFVCHAQQSSLADYYRQIHLYFLKGKAGSELDSYVAEHAIVESLKGKKGVFWDKAFHSNYQNYCKNQERRTPEFQKLRHALTERYGANVENIPTEWKEKFLDSSRPLMPLTNFLTFNSRAIIIYITVLADCPWVYLFVEILLYTVVYMYMHKQHEELCKQMHKQLTT